MVPIRSIGKRAARRLASAMLLGACLLPLAAAAQSRAPDCSATPAAAHVANVRDKGAKGDGQTNDTAAIQAAIEQIAGTGGTVLVPDGTYMVDTVGKNRLALKSNMTLKLAGGATLKAIPNDAKKYAVLSISGMSNVKVVGGTLEGERDAHMGKAGQGGMGIRIDHGADAIAIIGVTAKKMWGDGFYVEGATDVRFCAVTADANRRQGLSIIAADGLVVTNSLFKNTHGTRPSAGIDLEPDEAAQAITSIRIQNSKFIDNSGPGIEIAGKRGQISKVEITQNMFSGNRPMLVENAPDVLGSAICRNRQLTAEPEPSGGLNAFAGMNQIVVMQNNCGDGRLEVRRERTPRPK